MINNLRPRTGLPGYEEVPGYPQMRLESYVGAEMKKGASALWRDLSRAGDGARAIVIDESLSEGIRHAYNVINWRGMIIVLDGQTRVMVPFGQVLSRMKAMGEDLLFEWYRTN